MNILIVDDEKNIANGIAAILKKQTDFSCTVRIAYNGREACHLFLGSQTDLIITDIRMQEMDGLEMLKHFHNQNRRIRFIIISGYDDFSYAQQAIKLGVMDYLLKPIDTELLLTDVKKVWDSLPENHCANLCRSLPHLPFFYAAETSSAYPDSLNKILDDMKVNYMTDLSLAALAGKYMLSPSYLSHTINTCTGNNFAYLLDSVRLRKAAELLLSKPEASISDISGLVGYTTERMFYRAFQKRLSCTPGEFRRKYCK